MTAFRKLRAIPRQVGIVWNHPSNRGARLKYLARFVRWSLHKRLLGTPVEVTLIDNIRFRCHRENIIASAVMYFRMYEHVDVTFALRLLRPGDGFIDIGANAGLYTLLAASRVGEGEILSFEPMSHTAEFLRGNVALNGLKNVRVFQSAVGESVGEVSFRATGDDATGSIRPSEPAAAGDNFITVPVTTLDKTLDDHPQARQKAMMAKVDIEGAEMLMLRGATQTLGRHAPAVWTMEIDEKCQQFGVTEQQTVDFMRQHGFGMYSYDMPNNRLVRISQVGQQSGSNVIFVADDRLAEVEQRLATSTAPF